MVETLDWQGPVFVISAISAQGTKALCARRSWITSTVIAIAKTSIRHWLWPWKSAVSRSKPKPASASKDWLKPDVWPAWVAKHIEGAEFDEAFEDEDDDDDNDVEVVYAE